MMTRGGYADLLRVVGQLLDAEGAWRVEIIESEGAFMEAEQAAASDDATGGRSPQSYDIPMLQAQARMRRETGDPDAPPGRGELLRTLGQVLDAGGVRLESIMEEEDGYRICGRVGEREIDQLITWSGLHLASCRAVARRQPQAPLP
jgi:hypothetical protein